MSETRYGSMRIKEEIEDRAREHIMNRVGKRTNGKEYRDLTSRYLELLWVLGLPEVVKGDKKND